MRMKNKKNDALTRCMKSWPHCVTATLHTQTVENDKNMYNKSLHWIFTPLRSVKTSEFKRYAPKGR